MAFSCGEWDTSYPIIGMMLFIIMIVCLDCTCNDVPGLKIDDLLKIKVV